jgi:hypothetical protein
MKRALPFAAVGLLLAVVAGAVFMPSAKTASAAAKPDMRFARPTFETVAATGGIDLTRYGTIGLRDKFERLSSDPRACHQVLDAAGVHFTTIQEPMNDKGCGVRDAVRVDASLTAWDAPEPMAMTCALAARLHLWERHVVIPAAEKYLGSEVVEIEAFGAYSCRRVAGVGHLSEHAFGRAADIAGFKLADGREIKVLDSYRSKGPEGMFLREVHDRACGLFDVTLGPDYNADHANHFHLDVGGWSACH